MRAADASLMDDNVVLAPIQSWSFQNHFAGRVRALEAGDIAAVTRLYLDVYGAKYRGREQALEADLRRVFIDNPWYTPELPSLVFEEREGRIIGCVGVLPRPMRFNGRTVMAAVTHSFMVAPGQRATLAAVRLVRRFFDGSQDLSLADVNDVSRRIWESAGGQASLLYGLNWTRPLRPSRYALAFLKNRGLPGPAAWLLEPVCRLMDMLIPRLAPRALRLPEPETSAGVLDAATLSQELSRFTDGRALNPVYDPVSAGWLLGLLEANRRYGSLHKAVVRDSAGRPCGWYLYCMRPNRVAEVAQLVADAASAGAVLDRLFDDAKHRGAIAVTGQVDPLHLRCLSDRYCVFHQPADSCLMLHSRDPELLLAVETGSAFLTRLEGEWWISSVLG